MSDNEDVSSSTDGENLSPVDEVANLLTGGGGDEPDEDIEAEESASTEKEDEDAQDDVEDEESSDESKETVDESESDYQTWESALGLDEGQLAYNEDGDVAGVNVNVNGEQSKVKMTDLIAGYQTNKAFTQKSQALAEDRKTFDEQVEQVGTDYKQKLDNVEQLSAFLEKKLVSQFDGVDWDRLRTENPAEYAAARQDFSAQASELQRYKDAIASEKKEADDSTSNQNAQSHQKYLDEQYQTMLTNNPTWSNNETLSKDMTEMKTFLNNQYGFTDFSNITDARVITLMQDAMAYRKGKKVAATKRKKQVPKFQKSSGVKAKKQTKLDKLTKAAANATGDNRRVTQRDAIAELLIGK